MANEVSAGEIDRILAECDSVFRLWAGNLVDDSRGGKRGPAGPSRSIGRWLSACREGRVALRDYVIDVLQLNRDHIQKIENWPSPGSMTVNEFVNPPQEREVLIADRLTHLELSQASNPLFWVITSLSGLMSERLDDEHAESFAEKEDWRKATRDALRGIGGAALEARGRLGVFIDHSVSRAWWRARLAEDIVGYCDYTFEVIHKELRTNTWSELMEATASRFTVLCDPNLRAKAVIDCMERNNVTQKDKRKIMEDIARSSLTYCAAGGEL